MYTLRLIEVSFDVLKQKAEIMLLKASQEAKGQWPLPNFEKVKV